MGQEREHRAGLDRFPTIVKTVLRLGAKAVLPAPVRSFGLMSVLVIARTLNNELQIHVRRIQKLEAKLAGARRIVEAKAILMRTRGVTEDQAYDLIRDQAMTKRATTEDIAAAIINANEILSLGVVSPTGKLRRSRPTDPPSPAD